jgi:hypothetical protein
VILLRRPIERTVAVIDGDGAGRQLDLYFGEIIADPAAKVFEYAVLVTSLAGEVLTVAQLYRDRAAGENNFDELKNHWGWGGFTTQDLQRCRLMARIVALIYNWWSLFVRLADPDQHTEATTSRPLLLYGVGRQTRHARCQDAGIDLVGLDPRVRDRLHLQWIGNDHARHIGLEHPHHRHGIAGGLDHHLIILGQGATKAFQCRSRHVNPACRPQPAVFPEYHLGKGPVDIHSDNPSHVCSPSQLTGAVGNTTPTDPRSQRNRAGRRGGQLLTRARGSSNRTACPHHVLPVPLVPDGRTIRRNQNGSSRTSKAPRSSYRIPTPSKA